MTIPEPETMAELIEHVLLFPTMFAHTPDALESFVIGLLMGYEIAERLKPGSAWATTKALLREHSPRSGSVAVTFADPPNLTGEALGAISRRVLAARYGTAESEAAAYKRVHENMREVWARLQDPARRAVPV